LSLFTLYLEDDSESRRLEDAVRQFGLEVVVCREAGMNGKSDDEQLEFATAAGYVICTGNGRDFFRLHRERMAAARSHTGIIVRTSRSLSFEEEARRIVRIWQSLSAEEMVNRAESLSQWGEDRPT